MNITLLTLFITLGDKFLFLILMLSLFENNCGVGSYHHIYQYQVFNITLTAIIINFSKQWLIQVPFYQSSEVLLFKPFSGIETHDRFESHGCVASL